MVYRAWSASSSARKVRTRPSLAKVGCVSSPQPRVDTGPSVGYEPPVSSPPIAPSQCSVPPQVETDGGEVRVDVLLGEDERLAMLRAEARRGLTAAPKQLP